VRLDQPAKLVIRKNKAISMEPDQTLNGIDSPTGSSEPNKLLQASTRIRIGNYVPSPSILRSTEHEICFQQNSRGSLLNTGNETTSPCSPNTGSTRRCRWFIPKKKNHLPRDPRVPRKALHPNPPRVTGGRARLDPVVTARVARALADPSVRIRTSRTSAPFANLQAQGRYT